MKVLQKQFWFNEPHDKPLPKRPIVVDGFAGGGGASTGLEMALGRQVDIARLRKRKSCRQLLRLSADPRAV